MKKIRLLACLLLCLCVSLAFAACAGGDGDETDKIPEYTGLPEYDDENIEDYIAPFSYMGLTVELEDGESKQEKLWTTIVGGAEVKKYPEEQVEYYAAQERAKYRYYAERDDIEYDALLEGLGVTEDDIYGTAREMVKDDLVLTYIIKDAKISLTDEEKSGFLDKYAEKFTEIYGYDKEYVKSNMTEQLYDAMLYDKAMEYLLLNNTIQITQK